MNTYPHHINSHEPTRKQLWLAAYTSLLCHLLPTEAISRADEALKLADTRWNDPQWVHTWQYMHNYPVGHRFHQAQAKDEHTASTSADPITGSDA